MSTHAYDDKFPETDRSDDRTLGEKVHDAAQEAGGKIKEGWGDLTDNERLEAEGRQQAAAADARQAADRLEDEDGQGDLRRDDVLGGPDGGVGRAYDPYTDRDKPVG